MGVSDVRESHGQAGHARSLGFELVASKLRRPPVRSRTVQRSSLIERLTREDSRPVVSVVAPAGYGKTTLLSQWAEHSGQAFAWVSVMTSPRASAATSGRVCCQQPGVVFIRYG